MKATGYWINSGNISDDSKEVGGKDAFKALRLQQREQWGPCAGMPHTTERAGGRKWVFEDGETFVVG